MSKERAHIVAMHDRFGNSYIKSVSYANCTFTLTNVKMEAKGYATYDAIQKDINFLITNCSYTGYRFSYD